MLLTLWDSVNEVLFRMDPVFEHQLQVFQVAHYEVLSEGPFLRVPAFLDPFLLGVFAFLGPFPYGASSFAYPLHRWVLAFSMAPRQEAAAFSDPFPEQD